MRPLCFLTLGLLLCISVVLAGNDKMDESTVVETLNGYMLDLNALAEYAPAPLCTSTVNTAGLTADAATFVSKYFSPDLKRYIVYQSTKGVPNGPVVLNYTVGTPGFPTSASLFDFLKVFYASFIPFFGYPFYWSLSAPVVDIVKNDPNYSGKDVAYVRANNNNQGFTCFGERAYRSQNNEYQHVFAYNNAVDAWQIISFTEVNKGTIIPATPVQVQPV